MRQQLTIAHMLLAFAACSLGPENPAPSPPEQLPPSNKTQQVEPAPPSAADCFAQKMVILNAVHELVVQHQPGCASDSDCVVIDTTIDCQSNCKDSVLAADEAAYGAELQAYAAAACPSSPSGCGISGSCPAISGAQCVSGRCRPLIESLLPQP